MSALIMFLFDFRSTIDIDAHVRLLAARSCLKLGLVEPAKQIFDVNPFQVLDEEGMGQLIAMACEKGRAARPDLELGICGEHGGDPTSVDFCHRVGLDYVSCSPLRVPIARLAAAKAQIRNPR